jgi:hypothetical protein
MSTDVKGVDSGPESRIFQMPYKFLRGDTVRHIGKSEELIVAHADETGERYFLATSPFKAAPEIWASEDELEVVKRASDSYTGWAKPGLYVS